MASVLNSKAKYYQYVPQNNGEADHFVESEGDLLIKELSRKQLDINTSLQTELKQKKEFESSHTYQHITELTCGVTTHNDFKNILLSCEDVDSPCSSTDTDSVENKNIGRHVKELALSVKPNSLETKLLKFAISCNAFKQVKPDTRSSDHPINHLKQIEHERFGHLKNETNIEKTVRTILRKRKHLLEAISEPIEIKRKPIMLNNRTLWDVTEDTGRKLNRKNREVYTCAKPKMFTIRNGEIMELGINVCSERNEETVQDNDEKPGIKNSQPMRQLTLDEIKAIPSFSNYMKGVPSKTLYLKNLASTIREEDLRSIFKEYQRPGNPRITFILMQKGRMRGQAFVYFHDTGIAMNALEEINGRIVGNKPIIAQFSSKEHI